MAGVKSNRIKYTQLTDTVCDKFRPVLFNESLVEHVNEEHPAIESEQELAGTDNAVVKCKKYDIVTHSEDEKPLNCDMKDKPLEKPLTEETHAKYAKPEGNRAQAFNNALTYAKKEGKPFIYGYTNHTGKFFAAEQPMKVTSTPAEAEKEFRKQYKNCGVIYVAYPDKDFIKEAVNLAEYWWNDDDPMNWSDYDPIVYSVTYKGELVGYVKFDYMGYETYPDREEIEKLIASLLDEIDTIPEDYSMDDVDYEFGDYYDMDEDLPVLEEQLQPTHNELVEEENKSQINMLEIIKETVDKKGHDYWVYDGSGYVSRCIEIVKEGDNYVANEYVSTESGYGDTDPEYVTDSADFKEVIKVLLDEKFFDVDDRVYQEVTREEAEEYLK